MGTGKTSDESEFFITPDGKIIPIEDADGMYSFLVGRSESAEKLKEMLWGLVQECMGKGKTEAAYAYFDKVLSLADTSGEKVSCLAEMAVICETLRNFQAAAETYSRALELPQEPNETLYFLNNNLGYCLNQMGRHAEAEKYCRAAIDIAPDHHNAHKNLGVALQCLGKYADAARCFIHAEKMCPRDSRALKHLEVLIAAHEEILEEIPDLLIQLSECHKAVHPGEGNPPLQ
jgi:tetratricopeptide (TPR) repeat protein